MSQCYFIANDVACVGIYLLASPARELNGFIPTVPLQSQFTSHEVELQVPMALDTPLNRQFVVCVFQSQDAFPGRQHQQFPLVYLPVISCYVATEVRKETGKGRAGRKLGHGR